MEATSRTSTLLTCTGMLLFCVVAMSPSCGGTTRKPVEKPTVDAPAGSRYIDADKVAGRWTWSHVADEDGVRRVEVERWSLALDGPKVEGSYERSVTFLSSDGSPFECSQSLGYTLVTHYDLAGTAHEKHLAIRETGYRTQRSPCEAGFRKTGTYEAFLVEGGKLMLIWKGGYQTLERDPHPMEEAHASKSIAGTWKWQNRDDTSASGEVRVEQEEWELSETERGNVSGTYLRAVTVYDANGRPFACNGQTFYRYQDRYTVNGIRDGGSFVLSEIAVQPDSNACLSYKERHLDVAQGKLAGAFLELRWRGGHVQVLRRP